MNMVVIKDILHRLFLFLAPEKQISLKLIFDNIRNYAIIAVVFLLSVWLEKAGYVNSGLISFLGIGGVRFATVCRVIALLLLIFNFMQSLILILWLTRPIFDFSTLLDPYPTSRLSGMGRFWRFVRGTVGIWVVVVIVTVIINFVMAFTTYAVVTGTK
jgi:hypothetical protein